MESCDQFDRVFDPWAPVIPPGLGMRHQPARQNSVSCFWLRVQPITILATSASAIHAVLSAQLLTCSQHLQVYAWFASGQASHHHTIPRNQQAAASQLEASIRLFGFLYR